VLFFGELNEADYDTSSSQPRTLHDRIKSSLRTMDHMEVYEISRRNLKINDVSIGLLHDLFFKSFLRFTEFTE
jgi:hypothetical protein